MRNSACWMPMYIFINGLSCEESKKIFGFIYNAILIRNKHCLHRSSASLSCFQKVQGEHKIFPWLQTFGTRKLCGIQTFFLPLLNLVSKKNLLSWVLCLSLQRRYGPGWASVSFRSFLHPSRFMATTFQFLHPSLATSSSAPTSQRSLGLPLGRFLPGSLRRTLLDRSSSSSSSWRMTCPAHLSLLNLQNFTMSCSWVCAS